MYEQETNQKTNRTTVNKIIKNKLGFRYLKTNTKNTKINLFENKKYLMLLSKSLLEL